MCRQAILNVAVFDCCRVLLVLVLLLFLLYRYSVNVAPKLHLRLHSGTGKQRAQEENSSLTLR